MKRTGIFSGSFNPVHIGHLALANWLCEYQELDEVWFLVTPQNPLKKQTELIDDTLRLEMVKKAVGDYPKFIASDFEFHLPKPTYSVHTLQALRDTYPGNSFHFIMGADNWSLIEQWKDARILLNEYPIFIYPRLGYEVSIPACYPNIRKVDAPIIEISSSFIRQSVNEGKDVRFFIPEPIRGYFPGCILHLPL